MESVVQKVKQKRIDLHVELGKLYTSLGEATEELLDADEELEVASFRAWLAVDEEGKLIISGGNEQTRKARHAELTTDARVKVVRAKQKVKSIEAKIQSKKQGIEYCIAFLMLNDPSFNK